MKVKILILCTGNSCRSQMAEGFLKHFNTGAEVFSAGTYPAKSVNPFAVAVMNEIGIDISKQYPQNVNEFTGENFDYVLTVCDNAKEICPVFTGNVKNKMHIGFDDPADAGGSDEEILKVYRRVRDEIESAFRKFYENINK